MPTNSSSQDPQASERRAIALVLGIGIAFFLYAHFAFLRSVPGFHFDEAWSANLASDIARGLELRAQSAYTRPWSQSLAAILFASTTTNLLMFRLAHMLCVVTGIVLLALAMWRAGLGRAAAALPLAVAALGGLVANHRFAIEITGFHVLCFGLVTLGLEMRSRLGPRQGAYLAMGAGAIFGVTSHVLFLAPLLGLLATILLWRVELLRADRLFLMLIALVLTPFFLSVAVALPKSGKGIALVLLGVGVFAWAALGARIPEWTETQQRRARVFGLFLALPFLANAWLFADGHWSYLITHGGLMLAYFVGLPGMAAFLVIYRAWRNEPLPAAGKFWATFTVATTLAAGALMLKAAPRYYEIPLLCLAMFFAYGISRFDARRALVFSAFVAVFAGAIFSMNYFMPGLEGLGRERELRFLTFSDSSRDFLSKQLLVERLGKQGCRLENVETGDSRVLEALTFLAHNDWPVDSAQACAKVRVERRAEAVKAGREVGEATVADFLVEGAE